MCRRLLVILLLLLAVRIDVTTRRVAVTFDDLPDISSDSDSLEQQQRITTGLLASLRRNRVPAIGFVNEYKLDGSNDQPDPRRVHLIEEWLEDGCEIGNHTSSHESVDTSGLAAYEQDVLDGETSIRPLLEKRGGKLQWFRHPFLETGKTLEIRQELDAFLAAHGYRVAPVTIDDSEWIYDDAYRKAARWRRPLIRWSYIRYMRERFAFAEEGSRLVFGREIPQVVLLHAGSLNADAFDALATMIRGRGYEFVSIDQATADPAYLTPEQWVDGGVGWLERWGVARGIPEEAFTNDPKVPPWIQRIANVKDE